MTWRRALAAFAVLLVCTHAALADDAKQQAVRHFQIGLDLVERHAWDSALAEFLQSRSLYPTKTAVENAAVCLRELGRLDESLDMYDELVSQFGDQLGKDRAAIEQDMASIRSRVGTLTVQSDPSGGTVIVDERQRGKTPLGAIRLSAGKHSLRVQVEGRSPYEETVTVEGGGSLARSVKLEAVARVGSVRVSEASGRVFEVLVDHAVVGRTPWQGTLAAGDHVFELRGEHDMGSPPSKRTVALGEPLDLVLAGGLLPGDLRVEPDPGDSTVEIDGHAVGRGTWSGSIPSGDHVVTLHAPWREPLRVPVTVAHDRPQTIRPSLERVRRVYVELNGGMSPGDARIRGVGDCVSLSCVGYNVGVRVGYLLTRSVGLELFNLTQHMNGQGSAPLTIAGPDGSPISTSRYDESIGIVTNFTGLAVAMHLFDRTPLTLRLSTGATFFNVSTSVAAGGDFTSQGETSRDYAGRGYTAVMLSPEVRFGYRFTRAVVLDVGAALVLYYARAAAPPPAAPTPGFVDLNQLPTPTVQQGLAFTFPLTVAIRVFF